MIAKIAQEHRRAGAGILAVSERRPMRPALRAGMMDR
jgi:hypothetical protein